MAAQATGASGPGVDFLPLRPRDRSSAVRRQGIPGDLEERLLKRRAPLGEVDERDSLRHRETVQVAAQLQSAPISRVVLSTSPTLTASQPLACTRPRGVASSRVSRFARSSSGARAARSSSTPPWNSSRPASMTTRCSQICWISAKAGARTRTPSCRRPRTTASWRGSRRSREDRARSWARRAPAAPERATRQPRCPVSGACRASRSEWVGREPRPTRSSTSSTLPS